MSVILFSVAAAILVVIALGMAVLGRSTAGVNRTDPGALPPGSRALLLRFSRVRLGLIGLTILIGIAALLYGIFVRGANGAVWGLAGAAFAEASIATKLLRDRVTWK